MANKPAPKQRKIVDIADPSKVAPPSSAKSIIVSNRPILKRDPMVVIPPMRTEMTDTLKPVSRLAPTVSSAEALRRASLNKIPALHPIVAAPEGATTIGYASAPVVESNDVAAEVPQPAQAPQPPETTAAEPQPEKPQPDQTKPEPPAPDEPVKDDSASDDQLSPNKVIDAAKKKEEERQTAIKLEQEKIIESKKYYLPISSTDKRRIDRISFMLLVLVIGIALVWIDVALDAGLIHISGVHAVTHFFR